MLSSSYSMHGTSSAYGVHINSFSSGRLMRFRTVIVFPYLLYLKILAKIVNLSIIKDKMSR